MAKRVEGTHTEFLKKYHKEESKAIRRWDMGDAGGRRHTRGSGNPVG